MVKYISTYQGYTLKKDQQMSYLMIFMQFFSSDFLYKSTCCGYSFELHQQVDAIRIEKLMQFKWVSTTYAFIKK